MCYGNIYTVHCDAIYLSILALFIYFQFFFCSYFTFVYIFCPSPMLTNVSMLNAHQSQSPVWQHVFIVYQHLSKHWKEFARSWSKFSLDLRSIVRFVNAYIPPVLLSSSIYRASERSKCLSDSRLHRLKCCLYKVNVLI